MEHVFCSNRKKKSKIENHTAKSTLHVLSKETKFLYLSNYSSEDDDDDDDNNNNREQSFIIPY
jgi:hypothetical protein